jgi:ATP-dependent helicase/nuclease subunit A
VRQWDGFAPAQLLKQLPKQVPKPLLNVETETTLAAPSMIAPALDLNPSQQLGTAWHGVLQRIRTADQGEAVLQAILPRFHLPPAMQATVREAVRRVLAAPALSAFFSATALRIDTELDILITHASHTELKRLDRLVELDDAYWVLDYKWQVTPSQLPAYKAQVDAYAVALADILRDKPIRTALITAEAILIDW